MSRANEAFERRVVPADLCVLISANEWKRPDHTDPAQSQLENRSLPLVVIVVLWKLLPCDAVDHVSGVCDDDLSSFPASSITKKASMVKPPPETV